MLSQAPAPQAFPRTADRTSHPHGCFPVPAWIAESNQAGARFASSVGTAGDVNGDGYDDVVVGAPFFNGLNRVGAGRVYIFLGSASGLSSAPDQTKTTSTAGAHFGAVLATAGDANANGYADLLIGSPQWGNPSLSQVDRGRAYIYLRSASGPQASAIWTVTGSSDNVELGTSVATAGDVNGDRYAQRGTKMP